MTEVVLVEATCPVAADGVHRPDWATGGLGGLHSSGYPERRISDAAVALWLVRCDRCERVLLYIAPEGEKDAQRSCYEVVGAEKAAGATTIQQ